MQASQRISVLSSAAVAAVAVLSVAAPALAAPSSYQAAVEANNPYVYYRQQETGIADNGTAVDSSVNARTGTYNGPPTGGVAGQGLASDTAVAYNGSTGATGQYLLASNATSFGSALGNSSYEFIFKVNPNAAATKQSLYGVFSNFTGGSNIAAEVTLNSQGNDALGNSANNTRLFIRDTAGAAIGAHFTNPTLYDGNYHHLVYTFNDDTLVSIPDPDGAGPLTETFTGGFKAYVDGIEQTMTIQRVGGAAGLLPSTYGDFLRDPSFLARNVRGTGIDGNGIGQNANVTLDETALYTTTLSQSQVEANATAAGFVVPEPGSLALAGIAGLGLLARRRRQA